MSETSIEINDLDSIGVLASDKQIDPERTPKRLQHPGRVAMGALALAGYISLTYMHFNSMSGHRSKYLHLAATDMAFDKSTKLSTIGPNLLGESFNPFSKDHPKLLVRLANCPLVDLKFTYGSAGASDEYLQYTSRHMTGTIQDGVQVQGYLYKPEPHQIPDSSAWQNYQSSITENNFICPTPKSGQVKN